MLSSVSSGCLQAKATLDMFEMTNIVFPWKFCYNVKVGLWKDQSLCQQHNWLLDWAD